MSKYRVKVNNFFWRLLMGAMIICCLLLTYVSNNISNFNLLKFIEFVSIFEMALLLIYKYSLRWAKEYDYNFYNELPCYLCNLTIIITFIACVFNNRYCMGYCSFVGSIGALLALLMPDPQLRDIPLFSRQTIGFYGLHILLFISCTSFLLTKTYIPKFSDCLMIMLITTLCFIVAHITNIIVRKYKYSEANYIFTFEPGDNKPLIFFYNLIPIPLLYIFPIIFIYGIFVLSLIGIYQLFI